jgi:hypothetical protein
MTKGIRGPRNVTPKREKKRAALCGAIGARHVIEFYYHGGYRTVEPFALGITMHGEADNESLFCYQTGGYSDLNITEGWRLYRASEMKDIRVMKEEFTGARPGYDPDNIDMAEIIACVQPEKTAPDGVKEAPRPVPAAHQPVVTSLSHNELMRRFRVTHPLPGQRPVNKN